MNYWEISMSVLWLVVILILIYLVALTRQIGILHLRLEPTGARMTNEGIEVGKYAPFQVLTTIADDPIRLGPDAERNTILLSLSTTCSACASLADSLRSVIGQAQEQYVLIFGAADLIEVEAFVVQHKVTSIPLVISPEAMTAFQVSGVPYGFALDRSGIVRGKGIVNTAEHIESLANAVTYGISSMEQLLAQRHNKSSVPSVTVETSREVDSSL